MTFHLKQLDFIPLNNLLKVMQLVDSGGEANVRIVSGEVKVNGQIETQKRKKIRVGDTVTYQGQTVEVLPPVA